MSMSDTRRIGAAPIKRPKVRFKFPHLYIAERIKNLWQIIRHPLRTLEEAGQDVRQPGDTFTGFQSRDEADEGL